MAKARHSADAGRAIQIMFMGAPVAALAGQGRQLRALAVTSKVRSAQLPDVPTLDELGLKGFEMVNWWGFFGPAEDVAGCRQEV